MLSKNTIEKWIIPSLSVRSRGFEPKVPLYKLVEAILYRLKTGYNRSGTVEKVTD